VEANSTSTDTLHFQYVVAGGDSATPLEYVSTSALSGRLLRYSSSDPTIEADLTLPASFALGRLGHCCNVQIDSSVPFIVSVVPLKRVGIYGENETICILVRCIKPVVVVVVVVGVPLLALDVGEDEGYARYVPASSVREYDLIVDIRDTDVLFKYSLGGAPRQRSGPAPRRHARTRCN
jgi:hypothetical protein